MYNFTVPMALMDYLPVFFFGVTAVLLLRDLYNKMFKAKTFVDNGQVIEREVELFTWEKLDKVEEIRKNFGV